MTDSPDIAAVSDFTLERMPVSALRRVGPALAARLARLDIRHVCDLLLHLPLRYQDRTRLVPLAALRPGREVLTEGRVTASGVVTGRRRVLQVRLVDDSGGTLGLRFFHFGQAQVAAFHAGVRVRCFGETRAGRDGLEMIHPEYRVGDLEDLAPAPALTPVYPTTEGLRQATWRALTDQALRLLAEHGLPDPLPLAVCRRLELPPLVEALQVLHRPPPGAAVAEITGARHPACRRLIFEELLAQQLGLRRLRAARGREHAPPLRGDGILVARLLAGLAFTPTAAQVRAVEEIRADLGGERPMLRLLQGDVGAGKTLVAVLAALTAIEAGFQIALMAPTELLGEQHRRTLEALLAPLGIQVGWLTGRLKGRGRVAALAGIASGDARVVVGTHALFQEEVAFARLGLVVIDEQHRFGVEQRLRLRDKRLPDGRVPHQLIMTATPIPRSLAMALYADLDLSVLDELPPGRTPVSTVVLGEARRDEVIERVRAACREGRQAYWVCTLIEDSEVLQCQAAEEVAASLAEHLPELRIGLVHGRLATDERERCMRGFATAEIDLLVATTVIEVGVDVPNASLMIIENAERLGLSQLHQLRGRVGRGACSSHCVLLYRPPLSALARERLGVIRATHDGFEIAERDLAIRGAGEVLGTRQTGALALRIADPLRDRALVAPAQQAADWLLAHDPAAATALVTRWLGARVDYAGA